MLFVGQSWGLENLFGIGRIHLVDVKLVCRRHPWLFVADHWLAKEIQLDQSVFSFDEMILYHLGPWVLILSLEIQEDSVLRGLRTRGYG